MSQVRTRFAPSPTGYLHVGGARTALFSWLYARQHQGIFILRIEDTDLVRSTQESIDAILESMEWLGLNYDEGPYLQTARFPRYREIAEQLLANHQAYRCYCSKERLEELRQTQMANKQKPRYDGFCRERHFPHREEPYVIRFCNPATGEVSFTDLIRGPVTFQNQELDDLIIVRSDGAPTYNFTVVVDDYDMKITQVIRGDDHLNNTPRQINILHALQANIPEYAHVPMILGKDGKRFSKRHGAVSVLQYREEGYLPEALLNYLVRLGWAYGDQEIFTREEMIRLFQLERVNNSAAAFNPEKLLWLNQHYLKHAAPERIAQELAWQLERLKITLQTSPSLVAIVQAQAERCKTLHEMAEKSVFFYQPVKEYDLQSVTKHLTTATVSILQLAMKRLGEMTEWNKENIHQLLSTSANELGIKIGEIAQPLRIAMTGNTISPPIDVTLFLLGKEVVLQRIKQLLQWLQLRADVS